VAALISQSLETVPEVIVGSRGEFTVWVDGVLVGRKESADAELVIAVERAFRSSSK
jgi:hypothetical protein